MKKNFIYAMAFCAALAMASCSDDPETVTDPDPDSDPETTEVETLSGEITESLELSANTKYTLDGAFVVKSGATLTIKEGVEIEAVDDDVDDYILIEQGAKIDAQGTASNPIIMTSEKKSAGAWGGLHICGYASTNNGTGLSEIGNASYGGEDDDDNSGVLKYIRLEYTGFVLNEEQESNGVSFYGVGRGTEVSYLQAYRGKDDGFEFFGGTVNVKYLVATSCLDDSFDWTEGWRGKGQFLIAYHEDEADLGYSCDCLIEADNNGDSNEATPMAHPVLSNLTLVGNNSTESTDGVMLKAGTQAEIYNAIITGKVYPIYTKTTTTESALVSGDSKLQYITMTGDLYAKEGIYSNDLFLDEDADGVSQNNNSTMFLNTLEDNYYGTKEGGIALADEFFTAAAYQGAISKDNDWTSGWVKTTDVEEVVPSTLKGEIITDLTLPANTSYTLDGAFVVRSGATLTIGEGVTIEAVDDDVDDYILVEQGAKIDAQGSASNPIVMTSEKKSAGAWGGLHICGYASTNNGTGLSEIGNSPYGGDDDDDNSGVLKYIRLEYTGFVLNEEQESNGVSFYGVGRGTDVSYLQAYRGKDDGFEFFGGTVNVRNMIAVSCLDDSFDWTEGWRGKGQFLIAYHEDEDVLGYSCDCLIEADNNGTSNDATPMAHPILANLTLVGNNSTESTDGVMLKAGTQAEIYNAIVTGKVYPIYTKTTITEDALVSGDSKLENISMTGELYAKEGIYSNALFTAAANNNTTDYVNALEDFFYGTLAGGATPTDEFFTSADYEGAISSDDDWAAGWAILDLNK